MFNYICFIMKKFLLVIACLLLLHGNVSAQNKGFEKAIEVNGSVGLDKCTKYTFGANFIGGYRFNDSFFIGAGVGYTYLEGSCCLIALAWTYCTVLKRSGEKGHPCLVHDSCEKVLSFFPVSMVSDVCFL